MINNIMVKIKIKKNQKLKVNKVIESNSNNEIEYETVEPLMWTLQNKKEFPNWINRTFIKYRLTDKIPKKSNVFKPFKYQEFARDYLQTKSPYRGLLLYHGLGSGKTCTAITIAENLKTSKNILVILPASLKNNFIEDGLKFCGDKKYKLNSKLIDKKYTFISSNASNTLTQLLRIGSLDNYVIIADEVHHLISMMTSVNSKQGKQFYETLMNAKNCKLIFLSGTPIVNIAFEAAILLNLLRGYIEINVFTVRHNGNFDLKLIESQLSDIKHIDYVQYNRISETFEIHLKIKTYNILYEKVIQNIISIGERFGISLKLTKVINYTLYPDDEEIFEKYFLDSKNEKIKNESLFKRRMLGLVSYYRGAKPEFYPKLNEIVNEFVPMSDYQFDIYNKIRKIEKDRELGKKKGRSKIKMKKQGSQLKISSTFRVFSREFSNFVFPPDIMRPIPKSLQKENSNMNSKSYQKNIGKALKELWKYKDKYLTDKALKQYSPKMLKILQNIQKSTGLVLVYSDFRSLEGIGIFALILQANGYSLFGSKNNNKKFAIWSGTEDQDYKKQMLKIFNSSANKNGKLIKIIMITSAGSEGLDLKNVRQVHIMEPYWNEVRTEQVIGRAVRVNSHKELEKKEQDVTVFRYFSILTNEQKKDSVDKLTTDEYLYDIALRKKNINDNILSIMKSAAVDCVLNSIDNDKNIKCLSFGNSKGLAYLPKISKDIVYSQHESETKTVKKTFKIGAIDSTKQLVITKNNKYYKLDNKLKETEIKKPKLKLKVAYDNNGIIYDFKALKTKNIIKIGKIGKKNKIIK